LQYFVQFAPEITIYRQITDIFSLFLHPEESGFFLKQLQFIFETGLTDPVLPAIIIRSLQLEQIQAAAHGTYQAIYEKYLNREPERTPRDSERETMSPLAP